MRQLDVNMAHLGSILVELAFNLGQLEVSLGPGSLPDAFLSWKKGGNVEIKKQVLVRSFCWKNYD